MSILKINARPNVGLPSLSYNLLFDSYDSNKTINEVMSLMRQKFSNFTDEDGDAVLSTTNLQNTNLTGSVMLGMDLRAAVLTCTNLQEVHFRNARLERPVRGKQN